MKDVGSIFQNNAAINGGAINCNECNLYLLGTLLDKNYAYTGGTIFI
jgi:predicted outer membrane repeat protein